MLVALATMQLRALTDIKTFQLYNEQSIVRKLEIVCLVTKPLSRNEAPVDFTVMSIQPSLFSNQILIIIIIVVSNISSC